MKASKKYIPLLQILSEVKGYQRQIILDHLDHESCSALSDSILHLLKKTSNNAPIKKCLAENKQCFKSILNGKNKKKKKRALAKVGGGPLGLILSSVIPLLINFIAKKK